MRRFNVQKNLIEGEEIWVSCSGGVDSIAGAHFILTKLKKKVKLFHFNHRLRAQNWEMERAVKAFSANFGLPLEVRRASDDFTSSAPGEAECRKVRYDALVQVVGDDKVVMFHHLDDCVESYLMNCMNGVPEHCPIPISTEFGNTKIVRPFMLTPKNVFEKWAQTCGLEDYIVEDETNTSTEFRRNWVRHELRPKAEEHYPGLRKIVYKRMEHRYSLEREKEYFI